MVSPNPKNARSEPRARFGTTDQRLRLIRLSAPRCEDYNDLNSGLFWVRRIASNANAVYFEDVMRGSGPFRRHH